jgi:hypothetical protein
MTPRKFKQLTANEENTKKRLLKNYPLQKKYSIPAISGYHPIS